MDSEYILDDFPSDHHELSLTAADIEAIGSGYVSPVPESAAPQHEDRHEQPQEEQHEQPPENEVINHDIHTMDHGYDDGDFLPEPHYPPEGQEGETAPSGDANEAGPSRRSTSRNKGDGEMSAEEKKKKQREANKKAAERSRAKKRKDL